MPEFQFYGNYFEALANKEVDLNDGNVKVALLVNTYTPDYDLHDYFNDVSANEASGTGYTAGGQALTTPTFSYIPAASATAWVASTAYQLGDIVRPTTSNGRIYLCVTAGTSGGVEPTWTTGRGDRITDNTVVWQEVGRGYLKFDADDPSWPFT